MVVFLGSFYLLNLMLAVVAMSYENEAHVWEQVIPTNLFFLKYVYVQGQRMKIVRNSLDASLKPEQLCCVFRDLMIQSVYFSETTH